MKIFAHRGASGYAPENTLEAFELAVNQQADGVELDVHLTRDQQLLVAHDERIDRVSDGSGLIARMTLLEIKKHLFNKPHPEYTQAKAPTLEEVLGLLKPSGLSVNIELKNSRIPYEGMEEKVLELVRKMGMESQVLYSSFNHHSMERLKGIDSSAVCGLLYDCCLRNPGVYLEDSGLDAVHPHYSDLLLYPEQYASVRERGGLVHVWTVNDDREMRKVIEAGADIMITNYPDRALALRG